MMWHVHKNTNRGFTLLYAVLVSSLMLSIGLAIFNITIKELLLSSAARDSQFAFYAADTGIECALFWDIQANAFDVSNTRSIECAGQTIENVGGVGYDTASTFDIDLSPLPYCATVSVTKQQKSTSTPRRTIIESRGYNTCDTTNPRRVERAIRATY